VLVGEERVGPMSADEIRSSVSEGRFTLGHLGWVEGMENWLPLAEILESGIAEEEEPVVLTEGPGYVLTDQALRVVDEVFPLGAVAKATVEVEHTKRGPAIAGTILFGLLAVIAVAMPHKPQTNAQWTVWALSAVVILVLFSRCLFSAFKPSATFVAIHLVGGDDRILPMASKDAAAAEKAINASLPQIETVSEEEVPQQSEN